MTLPAMLDPRRALMPEPEEETEPPFDAKAMAKCECDRPGVYSVLLSKQGVVLDQVTFCEVCALSRPILKALGDLDLTMGAV
ncbi:MAG TPA: hypothetical protein VK641_15310 [Terriglobales bacterium]|nr:hypothetical protein [Terriglobales bacterium]